MNVWPSSPAELGAAVQMLTGMRRDGDLIDQALAVALLTAPPHAIGPLLAMRLCGWRDYPHLIGLLDAVAIQLHSMRTPAQLEAWLRGAS